MDPGMKMFSFTRRNITKTYVFVVQYINIDIAKLPVNNILSNRLFALMR